MCTIFILCKCNMHVQFLHRAENAAVQVEWHPTDPILAMREFDSFPSLLFPSFASYPPRASRGDAQERIKVSTNPCLCTCRDSWVELWGKRGGEQKQKLVATAKTATRRTKTTTAAEAVSSSGRRQRRQTTAAA